MLKALEEDTVALRDEFPENIKDSDLFEKLAGRQVVFITFDKRQRTRPLEVRALRKSGITALFFGPFWDGMSFWKQAEWLIRRWPLIRGFAQGVAMGTCAEIQQNGRARTFQL